MVSAFFLGDIATSGTSSLNKFPRRRWFYTPAKSIGSNFRSCVVHLINSCGKLELVAKAPLFGFFSFFLILDVSFADFTAWTQNLDAGVADSVYMLLGLRNAT